MPCTHPRTGGASDAWIAGGSDFKIYGRCKSLWRVVSSRKGATGCAGSPCASLQACYWERTEKGKGKAVYKVTALQTRLLTNERPIPFFFFSFSFTLSFKFVEPPWGDIWWRVGEGCGNFSFFLSWMCVYLFIFLLCLLCVNGKVCVCID